MEQLNLTGIFFVVGIVCITIAAFLINLVVGFAITGIMFIALSFVNYQLEQEDNKERRY